MSIFNLDALNNANFNVQLDTKILPWPVGEYVCGIAEAKFDVWSSDKNDVHREGLKLNITFETDDPEVKDAIGLDDPTAKAKCFYGIMIDTTDDGAIAAGAGKNIKLGRLLEAVDLNGKPWSPQGLIGNVLKVAIKHRLVEGEAFTDVKGVAHL